MAFNTDSGMYMPVAPAFGYGGGGGNGFGGGFDGDAWIILLILFALFGNGFGGWGGGGFGGAGNMMLGYDFPWLLNGQQGISNNVNDGFRDQMLNSTIQGIHNSVTSGFGDVQLGIAGVNQNICQTGNSVVSAVTGAQNAITQQMYSNQIAELERSFAAQTAATQNANALQSQLASCCCENRLATANLAADIARENCADRAAIADGLRDVLTATQSQTQTILDKMCQMEIDNLKAQNSALQSQVLMKDFAASQTAQTALIRDGQISATNALVNELRSCPIPSQPVYGSQPIFTCPNNNNNGCGCGGFYN